MAATPEPAIVSAFTLLKNFKPIETIIDGLPAGRGMLVSITANTGHCKTTLCALLEVSLCRGIPFAGREVTQGSVLVLAGENPDDYTMHLAATAQDLGLTGADLARPLPMGQLLVIPGKFNIDFEIDALRDRVQSLCPSLVAIFVDTSAAFYEGSEENDNVAMMRHADTLRSLSTFPGRPTVFVLCHPVKGAQREGLLPRGGGSFVTQVDANLTLWKDEAGVVTLHWLTKIRGQHFDPIRFEVQPIELEGFKDCRGRPIFSSVIRHLPDERAQQLHDIEVDDDDQLLVALQKQPGASVRDLGMRCGWTTGAGKAQTSRVDRRLKALATKALVEQDRKGKWKLTGKGQKEADLLP